MMLNAGGEEGDIDWTWWGNMEGTWWKHGRDMVGTSWGEYGEGPEGTVGAI